MQVRLLNNTDLIQAQQLWDYSFEKKDTPFFQWYFNEYVTAHNIIGYFAQDKLLTMLCANPYQMQINNNPVTTRYIVGVTTAPEARGLGTFSQLLAYTFKKLQTENIYIVLLKPIVAKLYTHYGFAFCHNHLRYNLTLEQLSFFQKDNTIELKLFDLASCAMQDLQEIYTSSLANYNGYILRSNLDFQNLLQVHFLEGGHLLIAYKKKQPLGYLLYHFDSEAFTISELMTADATCQNTFLNFVYQHRTQTKLCKWRATPDNLAYLNLDIKQADDFNFPQLAPFMMARIINVQEALVNLNCIIEPNIAIKLAIKIEDSFVKENNAVFSLKTLPNNKIFVEKSELAEFQIQMSISTFTQLYLGAYPVDSLIRQDLIKATNPKYAAILQLLFPPKTNYINEEF